MQGEVGEWQVLFQLGWSEKTPWVGLELLTSNKFSLDSWPLHAWFPLPRMLFPVLFAIPFFESQLECLFFQEGFPAPCPLAGPGCPAMCLLVSCVICCGSAEQEVVGLLVGWNRKPLLRKW